MARRSSRSPRQKSTSIQVRFEGGEDIPILFANNMFVRSSSDGFLVSFAQSHGPYIVDQTPEDLQREGVSAKIIARLLIPPSRMREFAEIFNNVSQQFVAGEEESSSDTDANDKRDSV
jgi:hypothetical protein